MDDLEAKLKELNAEHKDRVKIGHFSATSKITGIKNDVDKITLLLHKNACLSFWDLGHASAHIDIDLNPERVEQAYKDAVFISTHKLIGGPQTPDVLVIKRRQFDKGSKLGEANTNDMEIEDDNMSAIVESMRAGLVFQFKETVGAKSIEERERQMTQKAVKVLEKIPNLFVLGNLKSERLPIFSFVIRNEQTDMLLHPNFVSALLLDLFGIQTSRSNHPHLSRSSTQMTKHMFPLHLLGINEELGKAYVELLSDKAKLSSLLVPCFTRISFAFFFDQAKLDLILGAIRFVADFGWMFLPLYKMNIEIGEFRHRKHQVVRSVSFRIYTQNETHNFYK